MKKKSLGPLTGIRFLAAVHVMIFHMAQGPISSLPMGLRDLFGAGYVGVSMFFVLSGFILAYNYIGESGELTVSRADFYIARTARIAPVYFFCMLFALPVFFSDMVMLGKGVSTAVLYTIGAFGMSGTLIQSWVPYPAFYLNSPGWSLSNEAFFYAVFPVAVLFMRGRSLAVLIGAAVVTWVVAMTAPVLYIMATSASQSVINHQTEGVVIAALKYDPLLRLPEFLMGAVTGALFVRMGPMSERRSTVVTVSMLLVVGAVLAVSTQVPYIVIHNGVLAPFYALFIYALAGDRSIIASFLSSPKMLLLGEASFALYLFHLPFARYMHRLGGIIGVNPDSLLYIVPSGIIAIACSVLLLKFVEEPGRIALRNALKKIHLERLSARSAEV